MKEERPMLLRLVFFVFLLAVGLVHTQYAVAAGGSVRKERRLIIKGNEYYSKKQYKLAAECYSNALKANSSSDVAEYNLGLTRLRLTSDKNDTTAIARQLRSKGVEAMEKISRLGSSKPLLAAKAEYNLGNLEFESENYQGAIVRYKQALRLNPDDNAARRNLRIAQKKLQDQNKDQNNKDQDRNKDQSREDQNQNKQNQDKNKDKEQNQDQNKTKDNEIDRQTANQILQAVENKESQTRARMNASSQGKSASGQATSVKNW